jgi:hypothetical protein
MTETAKVKPRVAMSNARQESESLTKMAVS